jgi:hypothetical protein
LIILKNTGDDIWSDSVCESPLHDLERLKYLNTCCLDLADDGNALCRIILIERRVMGTICAHPMEKDECNETVDTTKKNLVQVQGVLGENISIDIVLGKFPAK